MFSNIGKKIKVVATVFALIGIIFSVIAGFVFLADKDSMYHGILIMFVGSFVAWLGSLTLYGFGQLIQNSDILVEQGKQRLESQSNPGISNPLGKTDSGDTPYTKPTTGEIVKSFISEIKIFIIYIVIALVCLVLFNLFS